MASWKRLQLERSYADFTLLSGIEAWKILSHLDVLYILIGVMVTNGISCNLEVKVKAKGPK